MGGNKEDGMETPEIPAQQETPVETTTTVIEASPEPTKSSLGVIRSAVKDGLKTSGEFVREAIRTKLVNDELAKRTDATHKVLAKIESYEADLKKIRPSFMGVTLEGKPVGEPIYKPEDAKKYKETTEKLVKAHAALDPALVKHDFTKVFELANKGD